MKCVGANNPPCAKCIKAGRICQPQLPAHNPYQYSQPQPQPHSHSPRHISSRLSSNSAYELERPITGHGMVDTIPRPTIQTLQNQQLCSIFAQRRGSHAGLPSIFSTPPVDVLNNSSPQTSAPTLPSETPKKRKRSGVTSEGLEPPSPNIRLSEEQIVLPLQDIRDMIIMQVD